jgi:IclR family transcriptional regulator, KDG regulon repressor
MPRITQRDQSTEGVQAVVLALKILEILAFSGKAGRVSLLASELGTSKNRIYRHLQTLVNLGYIVREAETERYRVGIRLVQLGSAVANQYDLLSVSRPVMRSLRDALGQTVVLSKVDANQIYAIERIEGASSVTIGIVIGTPLGLHSSAQGKLVLAFGPAGLLETVARGPLEARTSRTIVSGERLRAEVQKIRAQGWAVAPGETMTGLNALAVPLLDGSGQLFATLAILDSVDALPREPNRRQIEELKRAAEEISDALNAAAFGDPAAIAAARRR